jgi:hypothetical protein
MSRPVSGCILVRINYFILVVIRVFSVTSEKNKFLGCIIHESNFGFTKLLCEFLRARPPSSTSRLLRLAKIVNPHSRKRGHIRCTLKIGTHSAHIKSSPLILI